MSDPARSLDRAREYLRQHGRSEKWNGAGFRSKSTGTYLMVSTLLTLVVPAVYALVENSKPRLATLLARIEAWYWAPFKGRFGE